jgi:hypothetical protein
LAWNAAAFGVALLACAVLAALDSRMVEGANAWAKPSKFAVSFAVHLAALGLIARWTGRTTALFRWSARTVIATAWIEFALIAVQAARGVRSHFNVETPFDAAIFTAMGIGVGILTLASFVMAADLLRGGQTRVWASRVSGVAVLAGALGAMTAMAMIAPTPSQRAAWAAGGERVAAGSRFPDGVSASGPQLPLFGWRLEQGDWRIAHFFGVHALQVLALWGWLLTGLKWRAGAFYAGTAFYAAFVAALLLAASRNLGPLSWL